MTTTRRYLKVDKYQSGAALVDIVIALSVMVALGVGLFAVLRTSTQAGDSEKAATTIRSALVTNRLLGIQLGGRLPGQFDVQNHLWNLCNSVAVKAQSKGVNYRYVFYPWVCTKETASCEPFYSAASVSFSDGTLCPDSCAPVTLSNSFATEKTYITNIFIAENIARAVYYTVAALDSSCNQVGSVKFNQAGEAEGNSDKIKRGDQNVGFTALTPPPTPTPLPPTPTPPAVPPTPTPTTGPSLTPTETPSDTPTDVPTETPTETPSETPSETPTAPPSDTPTDVPTETPTDTPIGDPSSTPTDVPTNVATDVTTSVPSSSPSTAPSEAASGSPTP